MHHFCQQDRWLREHPITVDWDYSGLYFPPMDTDANHPVIQSLVTRKTMLGKAPVIKGFEAVTDAAHYAGAGVASVIFGPSGDGFHGYDEYVEIASLQEATKTIAAAIIDWCDVR